MTLLKKGKRSFRNIRANSLLLLYYLDKQEHSNKQSVGIYLGTYLAKVHSTHLCKYLHIRYLLDNVHTQVRMPTYLHLGILLKYIPTGSLSRTWNLFHHRQRRHSKIATHFNPLHIPLYILTTVQPEIQVICTKDLSWNPISGSRRSLPSHPKYETRSTDFASPSLR